MQNLNFLLIYYLSFFWSCFIYLFNFLNLATQKKKIKDYKQIAWKQLRVSMVCHLFGTLWWSSKIIMKLTPVSMFLKLYFKSSSIFFCKQSLCSFTRLRRFDLWEAFVRPSWAWDAVYSTSIHWQWGTLENLGSEILVTYIRVFDLEMLEDVAA